MSKMRQVVLTKEEILRHATKSTLESFVCQRLREHGIPVRGMFSFKGVKTGVLNVKRLEHGGGTFKWWPTRQDALDDGVVFDDDTKPNIIMPEVK